MTSQTSQAMRLQCVYFCGCLPASANLTAHDNLLNTAPLGLLSVAGLDVSVCLERNHLRVADLSMCTFNQKKYKPSSRVWPRQGPENDCSTCSSPWRRPPKWRSTFMMTRYESMSLIFTNTISACHFKQISIHGGDKMTI